MTPGNTSKGAGANRDNPKSASGSQPSGRPAGKGGVQKSSSPRGGASSPSGGSDDDEDATEKTAPGKPKEFDETVRRKRGEPTVGDTDADTDTDKDVDLDDEE
ncbi:MAG TPA: hypothetical protein VK824_01115 [Planctomycetota bacterium]|nr:hypothetical protein [Planctomycetota bacterium]